MSEFYSSAETFHSHATPEAIPSESEPPKEPNRKIIAELDDFESEEEKTEIEGILQSLEGRVAPEILAFACQRIRRAKTSEALESQYFSGNKAAGWLKTKGEIILYPEFFQHQADDRRHILFHEIAHSLIDAGIFDLQKLTLLAKKLSEFEPNWLNQIKNSQAQNLERLAERLTSIFLVNTSGTFEEAIRRRLERISQENEVEIKGDLNLETQMAQETTELLKFFQESIQQTTVKQLQAKRAQTENFRQKMFGEPEDIFEPEKKLVKKEKTPSKSLLDGLIEIGRLLAGETPAAHPEISQERGNEIPPMRDVKQLQYEVMQLLEAATEPSQLVDKLAVVEQEINARRQYFINQGFERTLNLKDWAERQVEKERFSPFGRSARQEKSVARGLLEKISGEFQDPQDKERSRLTKTCFNELRDLEALRNTIKNQLLGRDLARFYTRTLRFSGFGWQESRGRIGGRGYENVRTLMQLLGERPDIIQTILRLHRHERDAITGKADEQGKKKEARFQGMIPDPRKAPEKTRKTINPNVAATTRLTLKLLETYQEGNQDLINKLIGLYHRVLLEIEQGKLLESQDLTRLLITPPTKTSISRELDSFWRDLEQNKIKTEAYLSPPPSPSAPPSPPETPLAPPTPPAAPPPPVPPPPPTTPGGQVESGTEEV